MDTSRQGTRTEMARASVGRGQCLRRGTRPPGWSTSPGASSRGGARIRGHGTDVIAIEAWSGWAAFDYSVMPDRIEAARSRRGRRRPGGKHHDHARPGGRLDAVIEKLREGGAEISPRRDLSIRLATSPSVSVRRTYPAFRGNAAQFLALNTIASGTALVIETIFENRFMHVQELRRLGASIDIEGNTAVVHGVERLAGATVMATDLRASASLVIAGLVADGETVVDRIYHLDRGYERLEDKLSRLGARIRRVN